MKNGKLFLLVIFSSICCSISAYSQSFFYSDRQFDNPFVYEFGIGAGVMNCITDVGGANSDKGIYINELRSGNYKIGGHVYLGLMYENFIGARLEGTWGSVQADDALITSTASQNLITKNNRNLNFRSTILELALLAEFHPLMIKYYENGMPYISPYVVAGVGWFSFNPQTKIANHFEDLQPLRTEGQGFAEYKDRTPYRRGQINVPIGLGFRYEASPLINIRFEFLHRILFTDYLDDASNSKYINPDLFDKYLTPRNAAYARRLYNPSKNGKIPARRGNPDDNDAYMSFSVKVGVVIGRQNRY